VKKRKIRRRADNGDNYPVPSVLRAVATQHIPQGLTRIEFLSPDSLG